MFLQWVIILFASMIIISQSAMDFFATLMVLIMLWKGYRWRQQSLVHRIFISVGIDWLFVIWFLLVLGGYILSGFAGDNWLLRLIEFKWVFVFYMLIAGIMYIRPSEKIITGAAIVFGLCSLYAIVVWLIGFSPQQPDIPLSITADGTNRTGGLINQPIVFAHLYQLPLCVLFGSLLMLLRWRERHSWLVALSVILGGGALLLSFTRGVWISAAVATLVMTFLFSRRLASVFVLAGAGVFGLLYTQWPNFHDRVHMAADGSDYIRVWIWRANWLMFTEHPILGMGYDNNIDALPQYYERLGAPKGLLVSHAHNEYLHMLAGTGVLGTLAYLGIVLYFFVLSIRVWNRISARESFHKGLALGLIGAQVAYLVGGLTEANFEHAKMKCAMMFIWALTVWLAYEYRILREKV